LTPNNLNRKGNFLDDKSEGGQTQDKNNSGDHEIGVINLNTDNSPRDSEKIGLPPIEQANIDTNAFKEMDYEANNARTGGNFDTMKQMNNDGV
jgi:hypothetical protein